MPEQPGVSAIDDAVESSLGALLRDRDVSEIAALEGGFLEVVRRGKREKLDAIVEGPLFSLLRESGADKAVLQLKLKGGQRLVCGPLVDGRAALRIEKAPPLDATIERLVEEGVLPPGIGAELIAAVLDGAGVVVLGASRTARQRLVAAIVRALQGRVSWFGVTDTLASLVPVALDRMSTSSSPSLLERARAAVAFGADALCALEVAPRDLAELARASLGVPLVASATSSSMDHFAAFLDGTPAAAVGGTIAVVGHGPEGRPRLVELHGPTRETSADSSGGPLPPSSGAGGASGTSATGGASARSATLGAAASVVPAASALIASAVMNARPAEVSGLRERPRSAGGGDAHFVEGGEPLPALDALPSSWASSAPDDDPGWELGDPVPPEEAMTPSGPASAPSSPPPPGSFDAALAKKKSRPSFAPKPPSSHPQTASLRGRSDPFGGLTFEPPPGGTGDDDDSLAGAGDDDVPEGEDE